MSLFHSRPLVGAAYPVFAGLTQERIKELLICVFVNRALRVVYVKRCFNISKLCLKSMFYNIFSSTFASSFSWY